jgi:hypothetical protein
MNPDGCVIMSRFRVVLLLSTAVLTLASCESPLSPARIAGTYVLMPVDTASLPVTLYDDEWSTVSIVADTIRLTSARSGEHVRVAHIHRKLLEQPDTTAVWRQSFGYQIRGKRIEIGYPCPELANCLPPPHEIGRFVGDALVLESIPETFIFRREN